MMGASTRLGWRAYRTVVVTTTVAVIAMMVPLRFSAAQETTPAAGTIMPYTPASDPAQLSGTVVVDGSSTVGPITDEVAIRFGDLAPDVDVEISISGTSAGFERFCDGETDLQDASRPIEPDEVERCAASGVAYDAFEVAFDGITVVVNPANDFLTCLTVDQLRELWRPDSPIERWRDLSGDWPDDGIELYGPGPDSGTFDYFTAAIVGEEGASRTDYVPSEDDTLLVDGVADDENGLAYFGFAYYQQNQDRLKAVQIDAGGGCVAPTNDTIADGSYRPLSRPIYVYVKRESLTRPEVQEFMRFLLATAKEIAVDVGYVASLDATYAAAQTKLESAIAGTTPPDGPPPPTSSSARRQLIGA